MNWQPIETAPRPDDSKVSDDFLCAEFCGHGMTPTYGIGYTLSKYGAVKLIARDFTGERMDPTHWCAIEPPKDTP